MRNRQDARTPVRAEVHWGRMTRRTPCNSSGTLKFTSNPSRSPLAFKYDRTWTRWTGDKRLHRLELDDETSSNEEIETVLTYGSALVPESDRNLPLKLYAT